MPVGWAGYLCCQRTRQMVFRLSLVTDGCVSEEGSWIWPAVDLPQNDSPLPVLHLSVQGVQGTWCVRGLIGAERACSLAVKGRDLNAKAEGGLVSCSCY